MCKISDIIGESLYKQIQEAEINTGNNHNTLYIHVIPKELSGYQFDKYYVGITSRSPEVRWRNGTGYDSCVLFANAINKYGWENIRHIIVSQKLSKKDVGLFERKLIKYLGSNDGIHGYNIKNGGWEQKSDYGVKQYTLDGEFIKYWDDVWDASMHIYNTQNRKSIRSVVQTIQLVCEGYYKKAYNYRWAFENDEIDISVNVKVKKNNKPVYAFDNLGDFLGKFDTVIEAANEFNLTPGQVSACLSYRNKTAGDGKYIFSYESKFKEPIRTPQSSRKGILQITPDHYAVGRYYSIQFAKRMTGIDNETIRYCAEMNSTHLIDTDHYYTACGFIWIYEKESPNNDYHYTVAQYSYPDNQLIARYHNCAEASEETGIISRQDIATCCRSNMGENNNHFRKGYIWRYEDYDAPIESCGIFLSDWYHGVFDKTA